MYIKINYNQINYLYVFISTLKSFEFTLYLKLLLKIDGKNKA